MKSIIFAIARKSLLNQTGYRLAIVYLLWGAFLEIVIYYFSNKFVDPNEFQEMAWGWNFFSYVTIGYCYSDIFATSVSSTGSVISTERMQGTFVNYLMAPYRLDKLLIIATIPALARAWLRIGVFLALGLLLGLSIPGGGFALLTQLFFMLLTVPLFLGLGMIAAGFVLIDRRYTYAVSALLMISTIFSGAFYPIKYLPEPFLTIAQNLPFSIALRQLHLIAVGKASLPASFIGLAVSTIVIWVFAQRAFHFLFRQAQKRGSLLGY